MPAMTVKQIEEQLQKLPPEKLAVVYDFVSFLVQRETQEQSVNLSQSYQNPSC